MMMQQTLTQLRTLKLDGFADGLEEQLTQPGAASLSFEKNACHCWSTGKPAGVMIAVAPDCSSRRASNIRRPPLKISTHALAAASIRARSRPRTR